MNSMSLLSFMMRGYSLKIGLEAGSSICDSMAIRPSRRALFSRTYKSAISSMYTSLLYCELLSASGKAFLTSIRDFLLLPARNAPKALRRSA